MLPELKTYNVVVDVNFNFSACIMTTSLDEAIDIAFEMIHAKAESLAISGNDDCLSCQIAELEFDCVYDDEWNEIYNNT